MLNVAVPSKAGNPVALEVVLVGVATRDNNRSGQEGLVLHRALASKVVGSEEGLAGEVEDSEVASAVIEVVALVIEAVGLVIEAVGLVIEAVGLVIEAVGLVIEAVALVIEEALAVEAASDIKIGVDLEAGAGMRTALLLLMHRVDLVVAVLGSVANRTGQLHQTSPITAAMVMVIEMDTVEAAPVEVQGMTAANPEA